MPQTRIRFKQTGTLYHPTLNSDGQLARGAGTATSCAFWPSSAREFASSIGEATKVDGSIFVPSGTSIALRDWFLIDSVLYEVVNVHVAHDDRNRVDHIGAQLTQVSG